MSRFKTPTKSNCKLDAKRNKRLRMLCETVITERKVILFVCKRINLLKELLLSDKKRKILLTKSGNFVERN